MFLSVPSWHVTYQNSISPGVVMASSNETGGGPFLRPQAQEKLFTAAPGCNCHMVWYALLPATWMVRYCPVVVTFPNTIVPFGNKTVTSVLVKCVLHSPCWYVMSISSPLKYLSWRTIGTMGTTIHCWVQTSMGRVPLGLCLQVLVIGSHKYLVLPPVVPVVPVEPVEDVPVEPVVARVQSWVENVPVQLKRGVMVVLRPAQFFPGIELL